MHPVDNVQPHDLQINLSCEADNTSTDQESDVLHSDNDVSAMRLSPQLAYHE